MNGCRAQVRGHPHRADDADDGYRKVDLPRQVPGLPDEEAPGRPVVAAIQPGQRCGLQRVRSRTYSPTAFVCTEKNGFVNV